MSDNELLGIIEYILNSASQAELEVIKIALKKRMEKSSGQGGHSIEGMAREMARNIEGQMGIDSAGIKKMSRKLVADMIRQKVPDISQRDLDVLLDQWVPPSGKEKGGSRLPSDLLLTMISHFISYSTGTMKEKEKREFPKGWTEKYWYAFPPEIQQLIRGFLTGEIGEKEFWRGIRICLT